MIRLMLFISFFICSFDPKNLKTKIMNISLITVTFLLFISSISFSQSNGVYADEVFEIVEESPEFPGGHKEMMKFLQDTLAYPLEARANGIQGTTYVKFVVTKTGEIGDVYVIKSANKLLDDEAIKAVKAMPKWNPGKQRGEPVNTAFTLPVKFKLTEEDIEKAKEELNTLKGN